MKTQLNKEYWENRYACKETGWDAGAITTPLKSYFDQLTNLDSKILVPGAGNAYEVEYLHKKGFKNIFVIDIAEQPLNNFKKRVDDFPTQNLILGDFFELNDTFDLIIEQTFFCALHPELRKKYCKKMIDLLNSNGKIVGLFFNFPLTNEGPPFGGHSNEYQKLFQNDFKIQKLEPAYNSIKPRAGKELFFIFEKK